MDIRQLFDASDIVEEYQPGDVIFKEGDQAVSYTHLTLPTTPYV
jgi:hypothetical protein